MNQPVPQIPLGRYLHYKNKYYDLHSIASHSETLELLAVYRPVEADGSLGEWWVRPLAMFLGNVEIEGKQTARFKKC